MTLSGQEIVALIGLAATLVGIIVAIIGVHRATGDKIQRGDDALHERVNRLRQDVNDNYVRRVDMDGHMRRIDDGLKEIREDQKAIIQQLARLDAQRGKA